MLGSGVCGRPLSWWCSEVLRCSPKVAPNPGPNTTTPAMAECEQCNIKFNILRRRRECESCRMVYCGSCLKRGVEGTRWCHKCLVLTQWPLELSEVTALRVKDLRQFLHSRYINTTTCTEKCELIDLVTRHVSSLHRSTSSRRPAPSPQHSSSTHTPNNHTRHKPTPHTQVVPEDDGIRVWPSSNSSMGSIRVRPMDSIRVKPGPPLSPDTRNSDQSNDLGIRVFASEHRRNSQDTPSSTSPTSPGSNSRYPEGDEEECSHCPSDDWTASCCSLDSCHNGTSSQSLHCLHQVDTSSQNSGEWVFLPDQRTASASDDGRRNESRVNGGPTPLPHTAMAPESSSGMEEPSAPPLVPPEEEEQLSFPAPTQSSSSSASSSAHTSAVSSPEPSKGIVAGIVALEDLKSEEEIHQLSVRQCKELLSLHRVNYSGVREKSELLNKIKILWDDYRNSRKELENLPEERICKICMDNAIDCVLLECGHMVSCTQCGKQMSECPLCRQYVVRVVRTFRA